LERILLIRPAFFTASFSVNREITVTLGAHDVSKTESTQQKIKVEKQIVHPKYNFYSNLHDIMLLKVPLFFLPCLSLPSLILLLPQAFEFSLVQITSLEPTPEFKVGMVPCPSILF
jgi:hypothetical protein